jgi:hypothetical protein
MPQLGIIEGQVYTYRASNQSFSAADFVRIQANNDYAVSYQGQYSLQLTPDTYYIATSDDANVYAHAYRTQVVHELDNLTINFLLRQNSENYSTWSSSLYNCKRLEHLSLKRLSFLTK